VWGVGGMSLTSLLTMALLSGSGADEHVTSRVSDSVKSY
jgi:hypothetical protein